MRSNTKMTTDEALAKENGWHLVNWDAAYEEACDSTLAEFAHGSDPDDDRLQRQMESSVDDAVTNAWVEGMSHEEWVFAALHLLRNPTFVDGDRVESDVDGYDCGEVVGEVFGPDANHVLAGKPGYVFVAWDSGVSSWTPIANLRAEG